MVNLDVSEEPCPECGAKVRVKLDDIAKGKTVRCVRGHSIQLQDVGGGARKVQKSLDDLEKSLQKIDKSFKF